MIHTHTNRPSSGLVLKASEDKENAKEKGLWRQTLICFLSYRLIFILSYMIIWCYLISSHPILSYLTDLCSRAGWRWAVELSSQRTWLQRSFRDCGQESGNIVPKNSLIIIVTVKMARHGNIFRIYLIFRRKGTAVVHISTVSFLINNYQTHANLSSLNAMKIGHQPRKMVT